jgi:hypothetical protein
MRVRAIEFDFIHFRHKDFRGIDSALNWRKEIRLFRGTHQRRANHAIASNDFVFRNYNVIKDRFTGGCVPRWHRRNAGGQCGEVKLINLK